MWTKREKILTMCLEQFTWGPALLKAYPVSHRTNTHLHFWWQLIWIFQTASGGLPAPAPPVTPSDMIAWVPKDPGFVLSPGNMQENLQDPLSSVLLESSRPVLMLWPRLPLRVWGATCSGASDFPLRPTSLAPPEPWPYSSYWNSLTWIGHPFKLDPTA